MTDWLSDFETEAATFFANEIVGSVDDPYSPTGGTTDDYDWNPVATVDVRYEPGGEGYVREDTGEQVHRSPRVFAPPSLLETDAYDVEYAGELEGETFARGGAADSPTHRIVTCHHERLDAGDDGVLRIEMEDFSDG